MKTVLLCLGGLAFLVTVNMRADYIWTGAKDSSFYKADNWDNAPKSNGSNHGALVIANASSKPLVYTKVEGSTIFYGQLMVGRDRGPAGSMEISGGKLTIKDDQFGAIIGQAATGTLTMTGGTLALTGKKRTFVSNEADGTILLYGGTITMDGDLVIARHNTSGGGNYSGLIRISGGKLIVKGQTSFDVADDGTADGSGQKQIEFDDGHGLFIQTSSGTLSFPVSDDIANTYVNFRLGSGGRISLCGATRAYFEGLVKTGRIKLNGKDAKATDFQFTVSGQQGVYSLAKTLSKK